MHLQSLRHSPTIIEAVDLGEPVLSLIVTPLQFFTVDPPTKRDPARIRRPYAPHAVRASS